MATQGILSIVRNNKVVAKIVAGSDGYNIPALAKSLRKNPTVDPDELMERAREHGLSGNSLIVQSSPDDWICDGEDTDELPELYRDKFFDPRFNPRWAAGTAEYMEIVEIGA